VGLASEQNIGIYKSIIYIQAMVFSFWLVDFARFLLALFH